MSGEYLESLSVVEGCSCFFVRTVTLQAGELLSTALAGLLLPAIPVFDTHRGQGPNASPASGGQTIHGIATTATRVVIGLTATGAVDVQLIGSQRGEAGTILETFASVTALTAVRDLFWPRVTVEVLDTLLGSDVTLSFRLFSFGRGV